MFVSWNLSRPAQVMALNINLIFCLIKYITIFGLRRKKERKFKILGSFSLGGVQLVHACAWGGPAANGSSGHQPHPHSWTRSRTNRGGPAPYLAPGPESAEESPAPDSQPYLYFTPIYIQLSSIKMWENTIIQGFFHLFWWYIYCAYIYIYIYTLLQQA